MFEILLALFSFGIFLSFVDLDFDVIVSTGQPDRHRMTEASHNY